MSSCDSFCLWGDTLFVVCFMWHCGRDVIHPSPPHLHPPPVCFGPFPRTTWMTRSAAWYLSAQPPTRPSPCSFSWLRPSRETSLKSHWKQMKKWWIRDFCSPLTIHFLPGNVLELHSSLEKESHVNEFCVLGHRNTAEILWHNPRGNSDVRPENRLPVCGLRVWEPVSTHPGFLLKARSPWPIRTAVNDFRPIPAASLKQPDKNHRLDCLDRLLNSLPGRWVFFNVFN